MVYRPGSFVTLACVIAGGVFLPAGGAFGQISFPGQYPSQGPYPQGGSSSPFPGSRGGTITQPKNQASAVTINGILRRMSDDDIIIQADDKRIMTIALGITTKYYKASGAMIKGADMQPGDHLNIDAAQDDNGNYHAKNITQVKLGTAAERAAASQPVDASQVGAGNSSVPSPPGPNDPGPPRVRRGIPPPGSDPPLVARSDSPAAGRPSIHADDVNGVTRAPGAPVVDTSPTGGARSSHQTFRSSGDPVIDKAREEAFSFAETLPNYVVKQFTTRYGTEAARGGQTSWRALDTVTADVVSEDGKESYRNILINGRPPREAVEKSGTWSTGEYSSVLLDVLSPSTDADFHDKRSTTIVNRAAWRYDFSVDRPNSHWNVHASAESYNPEYVGAIWIDKENSRVLRIELAARNMPRTFALDTVESSVDYDFVLIGDAKFLLPVHSEALSCERGTNGCSRNSIDFRNYKKFSADTNITFDAPQDK